MTELMIASKGGVVVLMKTHLNGFHRKHGKLVEFSGFEMPVWYEGIGPEHLAVRNAVGVFDVTHMGRCLVDGKDAADFLNHILTRDVTSAEIGQGRYSMMCNERGGVIDDVVVFRLGEERFIMIHNAANRGKDYAWMTNNTERFEVQTIDVSDNVVMLAIQGPEAASVLQPISDSNLADIRYYRGRWLMIEGLKAFVTRTGYTGEDGFEILLWDTPLTNSARAAKLWQKILDSGKGHGIKPCGLGARDTLRLEAGMCLYGNDLDEDTTPLEAGLDFAVDSSKGDFIGKSALLEQKDEGVRMVRVGIRVLEQGIPRSGSSIHLDGKRIGRVTSGTFSPLLKYGIGMGYVPPEHGQIGTQLDVSLRNRFLGAEIVGMPFYDTTKYGRRRTASWKNRS